MVGNPRWRCQQREDSAVAAARELYEETGIESIDMGPVIWTQHVQFTFGGYFFDSYEKSMLHGVTEVNTNLSI